MNEPTTVYPIIDGHLQSSLHGAPWIEIRMAHTDGLNVARALYNFADLLGAGSIHHFTDEQWWRGRAVVRVQIDEGGAEALAAAFAHDEREIVWWDATPDERLYGHAWPEVAAFFEAASRLSLCEIQHAYWNDHKLVHCALNAWGYTWPGETVFAWRMLRGRFGMLSGGLVRRLAAVWMEACRRGRHERAWRVKP